MHIDNIDSFLFGNPLYSKFELPEDMILKGMLYGFYAFKADGHCPYCRRPSTFSKRSTAGFGGSPTKEGMAHIVRETKGFNNLEVICARNDAHRLRYWFLLDEKHVTKVGQFPSLADIANDEAATYREVLEPVDAAELHKAIGLAAHGVGIGSFVYLRRVFERIIWTPPKSPLS